MAAERGEKKLTIKQLRKLSKKYKRPLYIFYLNEIPETIKLPDFRSTEISEEEIKADLNPIIRDFKVKKRYSEELYQQYGFNFDYSYIDNFPSENSLQTKGKFLRNLLGVSTEEIQGLRDYNVLNYWKNKVENIHILVFQFQNIDPTISRGLSFDKTPFPLIAINQKDSYYARVFTMMHELSHIVLKTTGICDMSQKLGDIIDIEKLCNDIASEVIVPTNEFETFIDEFDVEIDTIEKILSEITNHFKVSWSVGLIKLKNLNYISRKEFYSVYRNLPNFYKNQTTSSSGKGGGGNYYTTLKSKLSPTYFNLVFKGIETNRLSFYEGMKYLGESYKVVSTLESEFYEGPGE